MGKGKSRGGRRRKVLVLREPNGRAVRKSQAEQEREVRAVGHTARQRVHGLPENVVHFEEAGYALGRLYLAREITKFQLWAGDEYAKVCRRYDRTMGARGVRSASEFNGPAGYDNDDGTDPKYVAECNEARARWTDSQLALMQVSESLFDPFVTYAVNVWSVDGKEAWGYLPSLRVGLNALARLYRVEEWLPKNGEKAA
jgi:hypothetical protein